MYKVDATRDEEEVLNRVIETVSKEIGYRYDLTPGFEVSRGF